MVYSSETGTAGNIGALAEDADVFLAEATYQGMHKPWPAHLSAHEAGNMAAVAGVETLILTYLWPTLNVEVSIEQAASTFGRTPDYATPNRIFDV